MHRPALADFQLIFEVSGVSPLWLCHGPLTESCSITRLSKQRPYASHSLPQFVPLLLFYYQQLSVPSGNRPLGRTASMASLVFMSLGRTGSTVSLVFMSLGGTGSTATHLNTQRLIGR